MEGFPRRNQLDKLTPAELAIHKAMEEVEKAGADVKLTVAILKLQEAKELVADFVDGTESVKAENSISMHDFIEELRLKWTPETDIKKGTGYHGSSKDVEETYTVYYNEYECEWTASKESAFKGYVLSQINELL